MIITMDKLNNNQNDKNHHMDERDQEHSENYELLYSLANRNDDMHQEHENESDQRQSSIDDEEESIDLNEHQMPLNELIVTSLPLELFGDDSLKVKFEALFRKYIIHQDAHGDTNEHCTCHHGVENSDHGRDGGEDDMEDIKFFYFRLLKRCRIKYNNESSAINARYELDSQLFLGSPIKVYFSQPIKLKNSRKFLEPPENTKTFLISPPSSPPVGWESGHEDPPVVNLNLVAALSKLAPHEPYELIKSQENLPGIVLHPCPDIIVDADPDDHKPRKFIQTRRPPSDMS